MEGWDPNAGVWGLMKMGKKVGMNAGHQTLFPLTPTPHLFHSLSWPHLFPFLQNFTWLHIKLHAWVFCPDSQNICAKATCLCDLSALLNWHGLWIWLTVLNWNYYEVKSKQRDETFWWWRLCHRLDGRGLMRQAGGIFRTFGTPFLISPWPPFACRQ